MALHHWIGQTMLIHLVSYRNCNQISNLIWGKW